MNSALIVIDVQESFRHRPKWQAVSNPDVVSQVGRLVDAARVRGDLVVWVLHAARRTGDAFDPVLGQVRLIDGLSAHGDEPMLVKTSSQAGTDWPSQCGSLTRCRSTPGGTVTSRRAAPGRGTERAPDLPLRAIDADDPAATPAEPAGGARPTGPVVELLATVMNAVAVRSRTPMAMPRTANERPPSRALATRTLGRPGDHRACRWRARGGAEVAASVSRRPGGRRSGTGSACSRRCGRTRRPGGSRRRSAAAGPPRRRPGPAGSGRGSGVS